MSKRRPSGDGMVRKREDGRWEGRIVVGHKQNGEPIFRYVLARTQRNYWPNSTGTWTSIRMRSSPRTAA